MRRIIITVEEIENATVPELLLSKADLVTIDNGYQDLGIPTPEEIVDKIGEIASEINRKVRDDLKRQLKDAQIRYEAIAPVSEKRQAYKDKIADLKKRLGE
jgi:hypothetical protein